MSAPERQPERLRRCVDQTIAAEALEGWRPTSAQVAALVALVNGAVSFDDYLAAYRSCNPAGPAAPPPKRSRRDPPYLVPGTSLLRNNFGASDHETLADLEFVATAGRMVRWHRRLANGDVGVNDLDVRTLHRQLFSDVYEWAGRFRICELRLGDDVFAGRSSVQRRMKHIAISARALVDDADDSGDTLADRLAALYADYNYVHPFREGNGRTGTLMLHTIATLRGRRLDFSAIPRAEWYAASRDSMPTRHNERADHRPFIPLFERALG
jgi:cell filamentation protein, protein adenylyltransferase